MWTASSHSIPPKKTLKTWHKPRENKCVSRPNSIIVCSNMASHDQLYFCKLASLLTGGVGLLVSHPAIRAVPHPCVIDRQIFQRHGCTGTARLGLCRSPYRRLRKSGALNLHADAALPLILESVHRPLKFLYLRLFCLCQAPDRTLQYTGSTTQRLSIPH